MSTRGNTKKQILDLAEDLLQVNGFNGFSYQHISSQLGVKNAAIHYHFPSKGKLGVALIQRYRDRFQALVRHLNAQRKTPLEKLDAYFGIYRVYLKAGDKICPAGILEAEFHSLSEEMRNHTRAMVDEMMVWLAQVLDEGRREGVFTFAGAPDQKALMIAVTIQGALQMARALGADSFQTVLNQIRRDLSV